MGRGSPRPSSFEIERLRLIRRLRHRSGRDSTDLFFAEGARFLIQAAEHAASIHTLVVSRKLLCSNTARHVVWRLRGAGTPTLLVPPKTFRGLSRDPRPSGIGLVIRQPWTRLTEIDPRIGTIWLLLRGVRSPGNLGTLLRSLAAVGGSGVVLLGNRVDPFDPSVVRATMGTLFGLRIVRTTDEAFLRFKAVHSCVVIGASPGAQRDYTKVRWGPGSFIFLGEERQGLSPRDISLCGSMVRIPVAAWVDSLNLGVAGSLLMYEAFRGRRDSGVE